MKYIVKFNRWDWPKRGAKPDRVSVEIDAVDDVEALSLGQLKAAETWPGAKLKFFDVHKDRIAAFEEAQKETAEIETAIAEEVTRKRGWPKGKPRKAVA